MESLGIAVLSGCIVIVGVFVCKVFWAWLGENVYLKITSRHLIDISGDWERKRISKKTEQPSEWTENITLKQYGWKIKGEIKHKHSSGDGIVNKEFEFEGILKEGVLSCYYWNKRKDKKGTGTLCLEVEGDGDVLNGNEVSYNPEENEFLTSECKWEKRKHI